LETTGTHRRVYYLSKPDPDGRTALRLTPLELIDPPAGLIPPPCLHHHRPHGVFAAHAALRAALTARARDTAATRSQPAVAEPVGDEGHGRSLALDLWTMLIARLYETFRLSCPHGGAEGRISGLVTGTASVACILQSARTLTRAGAGSLGNAWPDPGLRPVDTGAIAFELCHPAAW
jgi:hypothetical protein